MIKPDLKHVGNNGNKEFIEHLLGHGVGSNNARVTISSGDGVADEVVTQGWDFLRSASGFSMKLSDK